MLDGDAGRRCSVGKGVCVAWRIGNRSSVGVGFVRVPVFEFHAPEHGWMHLRVSLPPAELSLDVSDALVDSLDILAAALLRLLGGSIEEEVEWFLEPAVARWCFELRGEDLQLGIFLEQESEPRLAHCCQATALIAALVEGLCVLEAQPCWGRNELSEASWSWPFPHARLQLLKNRLATASR